MIDDRQLRTISLRRYRHAELRRELTEGAALFCVAFTVTILLGMLYLWRINS